MERSPGRKQNGQCYGRCQITSTKVPGINGRYDSCAICVKEVDNGRLRENWEAISSGCLLLSEENEEIKNFFIPYLHYVPFKTRAELEQYLVFFSKNLEYLSRIVNAARQWYDTYYSREKAWAMIFNRAFNHEV